MCTGVAEVVLQVALHLLSTVCSGIAKVFSQVVYQFLFSVTTSVFTGCVTASFSILLFGHAPTGQLQFFQSVI